MNSRCIAFSIKDPKDAWEHMDLEILENYGDFAYGHFLHVWDDGKRLLARCRKCGGYVLVQRSEYHSFSDDGDSYYTDWFFLDSREDADRLNRSYDGWSIEREYPERYLCQSNHILHWSKEESE